MGSKRPSEGVDSVAKRSNGQLETDFVFENNLLDEILKKMSYEKLKEKNKEYAGKVQVLRNEYNVYESKIAKCIEKRRIFHSNTCALNRNWDLIDLNLRVISSHLEKLKIKDALTNGKSFFVHVNYGENNNEHEQEKDVSMLDFTVSLLEERLAKTKECIGFIIDEIGKQRGDTDSFKKKDDISGYLQSINSLTEALDTRVALIKVGAIKANKDKIVKKALIVSDKVFDSEFENEKIIKKLILQKLSKTPKTEKKKNITDNVGNNTKDEGNNKEESEGSLLLKQKENISTLVERRNEELRRKKEELSKAKDDLSALRQHMKSLPDHLIFNTPQFKILQQQVAVHQKELKEIKELEEESRNDNYSYTTALKMFSANLEKNNKENAALKMINAAQEFCKNNERNKQTLIQEQKIFDKDNKEGKFSGNTKEMHTLIETLQVQILNLKREITKCKSKNGKLKDEADEEEKKMNIYTKEEITEICNAQDDDKIAEAFKLLETMDEDLDNNEMQEQVIGSEIDNIIDSYDELQRKNAMLVEQLERKEESHLLLLDQQIKSSKLQDVAISEKDSAAKKMNYMTKRIDIANNFIKLLEEQHRTLSQQVTLLEKDVSFRNQAIDFFKKHTSDRSQAFQEMQASFEKSRQEHTTMIKGLQENTANLEKEIFLRRRLIENKDEMNSEISAFKKAGLVAVDSSLEKEAMIYKDMVNCSLCKKRKKNTILTKCFHVFCSTCVQEKVESRNKRCPECSDLFGPDDFHNFYF